MILTIKRLLVLLLFPCITITCTFSQDDDKAKELTDADASKTVSALTEEQQAAFDALNELQTSTDEMNRLYSTFPNIEQPCYPTDTSFEITQSELLNFMGEFITKHCKNLTSESQTRLAQASVLAQEKYTVLHCTDEEANANYEKGLPMIGTWIMPNVLERRDIILEW